MSAEPSPRRWVDQPEIEQALGVDGPTVRRAVRRGTLPQPDLKLSAQCWRWRYATVARLLAPVAPEGGQP